MKKTAVIYWSGTGNTKQMAEAVLEGMKSAGAEAVLLEPSNGSNYQACAALTSLPDPVWAYIHFKVKIVEEKGSLTINKVDAETGKALAGVTYRLFDANGKKVADMTTGADGKAVLCRKVCRLRTFLP